MQKLKTIYMLLLFCSLLTDFPESCDTHCFITGFLKMYFTKEYSILPPGLNTSGQIHCFSWFLDSFCSDSGYSYRLYEYTNILSCKITHLSTDIQVNIIISLSLCAQPNGISIHGFQQASMPGVLDQLYMPVTRNKSHSITSIVV